MTTDTREALAALELVLAWADATHPDNLRKLGAQPCVDAARAALAAQAAQPSAQGEAVARFCPGCGSVGPVPEQYRDCCPDGGDARVIPEKLAQKCHDLFQLAIRSPSDADDVTSAPAAPAQAVPRKPIHVGELRDWLHARYRAAGGKENVTDLSAWSEEVMRWTEERHGIAPKAAQPQEKT